MPKECKNCGSGYLVNPKEGEKYCGFCGSALTRFDQNVLKKNDTLLYASYDGTITLEIQLDNTGMFDIQDIILHINNRKHDPQNDIWIVCSDIPKILQQDQKEIIKLDITPKNHPAYPKIKSFKFLFLSQDDQTRKKNPIELTVLPDPQFTFLSDTYELELDAEKIESQASDSWYPITLDAALIKSHVFIEKIKAQVDGNPNMHTKVSCDMIGRKLSFDKDNQFQIILKLKADEIQTDQTYKVNLSIFIMNYSTSFDKEVNIKITRPPRLDILKNKLRLKKHESIIHEVYLRNRSYEFPLNLVNDGSSVLFLEKIDVVSSNKKANQAIYFDFRPTTPKPIEKAFTTKYFIDTMQLESGVTELKMQFHYFYENEKKAKQSKVMTRSMVIQLKKLNEGRLLAVDFGTTNTYCAMYLEWHERSELSHIRLGEKEGSVIPTSISYFIVEPPNTISIGRMAYFHFRQGESNSFRSFKRDLGENPAQAKESYWLQKKDDTPAENTTADVISYDFLNEFIQRVQTTAGYKFSNYVFTHPTCFPLSKLVSLRKIIKKLGIGNKRFYMIDEATASALDFIPDHPGNYYLLDYDFGGGTIDIAYLEVNFQDSKKIFIDFIDIDGVSDFGGDDITEVIVDLICEKLMVADSSILIDHFTKTFDQLAEKYMKKNMKSLWVAAEEIKKGQIFFQNEVEISGNLPQMFYESPNQNGMPEEKAISTKIKILRHEVESKIFDKIKYSIELVNSIFHNHPKTNEDLKRYILLSGRSVAIPMVEKIFDTYLSGKIPVWDTSSNKIIEEPDTNNSIHFDPSDKKIMSNRSKECVARGAAIYARSMFTSSKVDFKIFGVGEHTTSRFGTLTYDLSEPKFKEYIPKNRKYVPNKKKIKKSEMADYAIYKAAETLKFDESGNLIDPIIIYQHFGTDDNFNTKKCCKVGAFQVKKPDACKNDDIVSTLCIQMMTGLRLRISVNIFGEWYTAKQISETA